MQRCSRCLMDDISDTSIKFDRDGFCNYCTYALRRMDTVYFPNEEGKRRLSQMIDMLKKNGKSKDFDCLMGISGGLDSAYLAYLASIKWGLRIIAFHIDDGFNSAIAEKNIERLCNKCNIDLIINTVDRTQFNDLTRAFILADLPGICVPQDNIIESFLYDNAKKYKINYFLSGSNFALESILQRFPAINQFDAYHIKAVSKEFGSQGLDKLPLISIFDKYVKAKVINRLHILRPLDFIDYKKKSAIQELHNFCGFDYYGGKHYESILTHFAQVYYLPEKFKVDKRTSHLSSLIVSGQLSREEALNELSQPLISKTNLDEIINFVLDQLHFDRGDFENIMKRPPRSHFDYPYSKLNNYASLARKFRKFLLE